MPYEPSSDHDPRVTYYHAKVLHMDRAVEGLDVARGAIDDALRRSTSDVDRTALSTAYNLVREAGGLVILVQHRIEEAEETDDVVLPATYT